MPKDDEDAFAGFDLPESPEAPQPPPTLAAPAPEPPRELRASDFEFRDLRYPRSCKTCMHFVKGGGLAVDQILALRDNEGPSGLETMEECRDHEKDFELRELEQIAEKAKTLDTRFDGIPRVHSYCIAGSTPYASIAHIPQIKNHDGRCVDYFVGARPQSACSTCVSHQAPRKERPNPADPKYRPNVDGLMNTLGRDFVDGDLTRSIGKSIINEHERVQKRYETDVSRYESNLAFDAKLAIVYGKDPENGTISTCRAPGQYGTACATANRSGHCPRWSGNGANEVMSGGKRWVELQALPHYAADVEDLRRGHERASDTWREKAPRLPAAQCATCDHVRYGADIDPFDEIHLGGKEIQQARDAWRREDKKRAVDEQRIATLPGPALGHAEAPTRHLWCEKYSQRGADGRVVEFAYCYRVLKREGGECPSYTDRAAARTARAEWICKTCGFKNVEPRDGRLWCTWCSAWTEQKGPLSREEFEAQLLRLGPRRSIAEILGGTKR